MGEIKNIDLQNVQSVFDFKTNSLYKLFCGVTTLERSQNQLRYNCDNSTETSANPAFLKLKESKNTFYNSIYSIKHLYEQNKQKIERTCQKLKEESEESDMLLETYSKLFVGTWSLLYIEYVMSKYLGLSVEYEKYLEKVATFSDRYSNYTDVLSYYLSLTNVYEKVTSEYYTLLEILKKYSFLSSGKVGEISSHLLGVIKNLNEYESQLAKVKSASQKIQDSISRLQSSGYHLSFKSVKTKYYIESLLQDIIDEGEDKTIKNQPLQIQLNVIRNKIVLLRLVVSRVKYNK